VSGREQRAPRAGAWAAWVLALGLAGCGTEGVSGAIEPLTTVVNALHQIQNAPSLVAHQGIRRVEFHGAHLGVPQDLVLLESCTTDGKGGFELRLLQASGEPHVDFASMELFHARNQAFFFRYRDFLIRDLDLLLQNYQVRTLPHVAQVAGRDCVQMELERLVGGQPTRWSVASDFATGLVLRCRETDAQGVLRYSMEYQTVDFAPELEGADLQLVGDDELVAADLASLQHAVGFEPYQPQLLPPGYQLRTLRSLREADGSTWANFVYGDGIDSLFFLHGGPGSAVLQVGGGTLQQEQSMHSSPYSMLVYETGAWTVVQGSWQGQRVLAVGKATSDELLALIESALP
jgi:hypothetical protein